MHAIERRPNHFRFQALTSTPTNFHPSLIRSKLPSKPKFRTKSARLWTAAVDRGSAQLFPRAAVKNRIAAGRGASTLRLTSGRKQTESPHGAGNPPKRATSLLKFVKLYPPPPPSIIRSPFDFLSSSIHSSFRSNSIRGKRRWKMTRRIFPFFLEGNWREISS